MLAANCDSGDHVLCIAWDYNSDWNLTIVGAVGGVERATAVVETDFAPDLLPQCRLQSSRIRAGALGGVRNQSGGGRPRLGQLKITLPLIYLSRAFDDDGREPVVP